ncbi:MAG: ATP-binding protein [Burkholderiales bacterium]
MTTSIEDGSLARFRDEARAIRDRADWRIFALLCTASLAVTLLFSIVILTLRPNSPLLWPNALAFVTIVGTTLWTRRTQRVPAGIAVLATVMIVGISGVILVQRGSNAPAVLYGLTTVTVLFFADRSRLGARLGAWLIVWTGAVTWAAQTGRFGIDAPNPLGADNARMLALIVAAALIGLAARVGLQRRRGLDALLERALQFTAAERDAAQRLAERRARTVAEIGHEIRTPMTGIVGATQLLSQQAMSPIQRQLLSIQRQSVERLLHLVTAVLDEAKAESGQMALRSAPYPLRTLTAEVTELFAPQAHRKGVEIIWTAEPSLPNGVVGDAMRMRQILSNLVSNAVKFTDHGSVHVHMFLTGPAQMRIEVRDTGRGIPAARQEAIFERFVSDTRDDEQTHSTGLGLPICRELARGMGGRITVSSRLAEGSCFALEMPCVPALTDSAEHRLPERPPPGRLWVIGASAPLATQLRFIFTDMEIDARFIDRLPTEAEWAEDGAPAQALMVDIWVGHGRCVELLPEVLDAVRRNGRRVIVINNVAQDAALGVLDDVWQVFRPPRWTSLREALTWAFSGTSHDAPLRPARPTALRVLLVDDNAVNQIVGKAMLELLGTEVLSVSGGQAAIDEALLRRFDLILMDLQMPEMDGYEATRRLRDAESRLGRARTPVVAVTGQVDGEVQAACRAAGMESVLIKPYTVDQMRVVIDTHSVGTTA